MIELENTMISKISQAWTEAACPASYKESTIICAAIEEWLLNV